MGRNKAGTKSRQKANDKKYRLAQNAKARANREKRAAREAAGEQGPEAVVASDT